MQTQNKKYSNLDCGNNSCSCLAKSKMALHWKLLLNIPYDQGGAEVGVGRRYGEEQRLLPQLKYPHTHTHPQAASETDTFPEKTEHH